MRGACRLALTCLAVAWLAGCGGSTEKPTTDAQGADAAGADREPQGAKDKAPPTASISGAKAKPIDGLEFEGGENFEEEPALAVEPEKGTPEWSLWQIVNLQALASPKTDDLEKLRKARKERNEKIIELAADVIAKTHKSKEQARLFDVAVHHLLDARLQLALAGDKESIESLYDDAASLWERDKDSRAAADAAYTLVNLAYTNARQIVPQDLKWLQEFLRQARNFAVNFPKEERRSVPLLFTAAHSCELNGLPQEAIGAFKLIQEKFPQSEYGLRVAGILRRLNLVGQSFKLAGPTLTGERVAIEGFRGKPVLIVYWTMASKPFVDSLPALTALHEKYGDKLAILCVSMDVDRPAVEKFVAEKQLPGTQIFYAPKNDQDQNIGWNNPAANYYGILQVSGWLVDDAGRALSTTVDLAKADEEVTRLLSK